MPRRTAFAQHGDEVGYKYYIYSAPKFPPSDFNMGTREQMGYIPSRMDHGG